MAAMDGIIALIRERGARTLYITDEGVTFHADATWHVRCSTSSAGPLFSHVGVMAVCHMIAEQVIAACGPDAAERLRRFEAINESLGHA